MQLQVCDIEKYFSSPQIRVGSLQSDSNHSRAFFTNSKRDKVLSMTQFMSYLRSCGKFTCNSLYSIQTLKYGVNSLFLLRYRNNFYTKMAHRKCCFMIFENIIQLRDFKSFPLKLNVAVQWLRTASKSDSLRPNKHLS